MGLVASDYEIVPSVFTEAEVAEIIEKGKSHPLNRAKVLKNGLAIPDFLQRRAKQAWMELRYDTRWIFNKVSDAVRSTELYGTDITSMEPLHFIEYGFAGGYGTHVDDSAPRVRNRKLTAIVKLTDSDAYWGNGLMLHPSEKVHIRIEDAMHKGDVLVFRSSLPHSVGPVWRGTRHAIAAWFRSHYAEEVLKRDTLLYQLPKPNLARYDKHIANSIQRVLASDEKIVDY